jgi:hypothetical protein
VPPLSGNLHYTSYMIERQYNNPRASSFDIPQALIAVERKERRSRELKLGVLSGTSVDNV